MSALPGISPVEWEAQYRKGQVVKLDWKEQVTIKDINPFGGDSAKYKVEHADGRIESDILEKRLS